MIEAMKQALEALKSCSGVPHWPALQPAITSLRQAIAELESQEPVATVTSETGADITMSWWHEPALPVGTKLFTHPPQRTWVGLTDEEAEAIWEDHQFNGRPSEVSFANRMNLMQAIEAKLKEKNT
jgi:hypothetical protein